MDHVSLPADAQSREPIVAAYTDLLGGWRAALRVVLAQQRAGDSLALVAVHVATREVADWIWATAWWHDEQFAVARIPDHLRARREASVLREQLYVVGAARELPPLWQIVERKTIK
ncbi:MAG TPA: hypothetical protein PLO33_12465, partial [Kouleothrix sp.]|nr:hypothetical protein [Kouleothrix sp.]